MQTKDARDISPERQTEVISQQSKERTGGVHLGSVAHSSPPALLQVQPMVLSVSDGLGRFPKPI
jgi:hypothetical protein